jgi:hypothetical protein
MHSSVTQRSKVIAISQNFRGCPGRLCPTDSCAIAPSLWACKAQGQECHLCDAPKRDDWTSSHFFLFLQKVGKKWCILVHTGPLQGSGELLPQQDRQARADALLQLGLFFARLSRPCVHTGPDLRADRQARWEHAKQQQRSPPPSRDAAAPVGRPHVVGIHDAILNLVPA